jgi:hypothetical protein
MQAFPIRVDDFDQVLVRELARVLDGIVNRPARPRSRSWREGRRGRLRTLKGGLSDRARETVPLEVPAAMGKPSSTPL